ncbi:MAG TPA: ATP-binding protein [archaeon]|nr:ATP-binding protein [archaeon]
METLKRELLNHKLILSIEGPRRVGKSVLIKQLINYLIEKKVPSTNIFYFSFDKLDKKILDTLKDYEELSGISLREEKTYLFFDEIQKIKDWQSDIKIIYDNYPNIKLVVSGSTLRVSKKESLAGRLVDFFVNPLSFEEYLIFSGKEKLLDSGMDYIFEKEYNNYLFRQYPDIVLNKDIDSKQYLLLILQKVIFEDSEKYIKNVDKDILYKICMVILRDPGEIINYSDLSKDLGVKRGEVSKYIDFLVNSSIIRKIYNFSNNSRKLEIKSKKFYPYCTSLTRAITDNPDMSKIIETDVCFQLDAKYFLNNKGKEEIDFLLIDPITSKKIGVEVKYRNLITNKDTNAFKSVIVKKLNLSKKIIIVKAESKLDFNTKEIIPIKYFSIFRHKSEFDLK